jgi:8-oxo-dGTP diphosphatase
MKKRINVVGAVIVNDGKILCAQRGVAGNLPHMWEFPGGKIEPGETPEQALGREIIEELECHIVVGEHVDTTTHEYDFGIVTLTTFFCKLLDGAPRLTEHAALEWLIPADLSRLDWAPADIPAIEKIQLKLTP